MTDPDSLSLVTSFTGTKDEEWFFMISAAIEAKGGRLISLMFQAIEAVHADNAQLLVALFDEFTDVLRALSGILKRMSEKCAPQVFFHQLRPILAGSKNMAAAGLPNGVFYDRGNGQGEWRQYSGGSNGQSSLLQAFDIFLGVEHWATGDATRKTKTPFLMVCVWRGVLVDEDRSSPHFAETIGSRTCETTCLVLIDGVSSVWRKSPTFVPTPWTRKQPVRCAMRIAKRSSR